MDPDLEDEGEQVFSWERCTAQVEEIDNRENHDDDAVKNRRIAKAQSDKRRKCWVRKKDPLQAGSETVVQKDQETSKRRSGRLALKNQANPGGSLLEGRTEKKLKEEERAKRKRKPDKQLLFDKSGSLRRVTTKQATFKRAKTSPPEIDVTTQDVLNVPAGAEFFLPPEKKALLLQKKRNATLKQDILRAKTVDQKWNDGRKLHPFLLPKQVHQKSSSDGGCRQPEFSVSKAHDCPTFPPVAHVQSISTEEMATLQSLQPSEHFKLRYLSTLGDHSTKSTATECHLFDHNRQIGVAHRKGCQQKQFDVRDTQSKEEALKELLEDLPEVKSGTAYVRFEEMMQRLCIYAARSVAQDMLWNVKYRPLAPSEVLGNVGSVQSIDTWLRSWLPNSDRRHDKEGAEGERVNTLLLSGPVGCGKTAAVYACAAAQGWNVLEVNASSQRTGRSILQMFGEATQSHHMGIAGQAQNLPSHSLMLFEEIDLLLDHDKGFLSALRSLIVDSKRPIILTCNEIDKEFETILGGCYLHVPMALPSERERTDYVLALRLISLAEGFTLGAHDAELLLEHCGGDMRRALSSLQFWWPNLPRSSLYLGSFTTRTPVTACHLGFGEVLRTTSATSGDPSMSSQLLLLGHNSGINLVHSNYLPVLSTKPLSLSVLEATGSIAEIVSLVDQLECDLAQSTMSYTQLTLSETIGAVLEEMVSSIWLGGTEASDISFNTWGGTKENNRSMRMRLQLVLLEQLPFLFANAMWTAREQLLDDYLPTLKQIVLAESNRQQANTKRRFRHYLHPANEKHFALCELLQKCK